MQGPTGQAQPHCCGVPAAVLKYCQAFSGQSPRSELRQGREKRKRLHLQQFEDCNFVAIQSIHDGTPRNIGWVGCHQYD